MEIFITKEDLPLIIEVLSTETFEEINILRTQSTDDPSTVLITLNNCNPTDIYLLAKWVGMKTASKVYNETIE
jgi:hypothetical protein